MKKIIIAFVLVLLFIFPGKADAHVLKTDGSIGAVLHIDPDDNPVAGENSNFFFEMKDKEGKFRIERCDCGIEIKKAGEVVYEGSVSGDSNGLVALYTFPEVNVYTVQLRGIPKTEGDFQPFTLSYDVRVERGGQVGEETATSLEFLGLHLLHIALIIGSFIFVVFLIVRQSKSPKRS